MGAPSFALPQDILARVLQYLDLQQRLGACALVSHTWHDAAAAATTDINVALKHQHSGHSLVQWLGSRGGPVTNLQLAVVEKHSWDDDSYLDISLPCLQLQQLQSLSLQGFQLLEWPGSSSSVGSNSSTSAAAGTTAGAAPSIHHSNADGTQLQRQCAAGRTSTGSESNSQPNSLVGLASLTAFHLQAVRWSGFSEGLRALSVLTGLQRLQLEDVTVVSSSGLTAPADSTAGAMSEQQQQQQLKSLSQPLSLQQLVQLTHLTVDPDLFEEDAVAPLSCLEQLRELRIGSCISRPEVLAGLPPSITLLCFGWMAERSLDNDSIPALCTLTAMQHLEVSTREDDSESRVNPVILTGMQQLRHLQLDGLCGDSLAVLLDVLPRLTLLEDLALDSNHELMPLPPGNAKRYSALLPSSTHLTRFVMKHNHPDLVPVGAGKHMFAAGRQWPGLKQLKLWTEEYDEYNERPQQFLGPGDVCRLVSCCPALQQLCIPLIVQPGVQMTALVQLTGLTDLVVGGEVVNDDVAQRVLAQLTGLQRLEVSDAPQFTDVGLWRLTDLVELRDLQVLRAGLSEGLDNGTGLDITSTASTPDVMRRLAERCPESPARLRLMREELALSMQALEQERQRLRNMELRMRNNVATQSETTLQLCLQLATAQRHMAAAQEQLAASQARVRRLEQQLAGSDSDAGGDVYSAAEQSDWLYSAAEQSRLSEDWLSD